MNISILHLYPREMNLYGDHGNVLTLKKRCQWRNINVEIINYEAGQTFPSHPDIIFGGGGQDSGQIKIIDDLQKIAPKLKALIDAGTPTLTICGLYQLFGHFFRTQNDDRLPGIGIFDIETVAGPQRLIGNTIIKSSKFGQIVGYENHSGLTTLKSNAKPFGTVVLGAGNNGKDQTEGAIYKNAIGTYLHGPLLPKNPKIADYFIKVALERKYAPQILPKLDDKLTQKAHEYAAKLER